MPNKAVNMAQPQSERKTEAVWLQRSDGQGPFWPVKSIGNGRYEHMPVEDFPAQEPEPSKEDALADEANHRKVVKENRKRRKAEEEEKVNMLRKDGLKVMPKGEIEELIKMRYDALTRARVKCTEALKTRVWKGAADESKWRTDLYIEAMADWTAKWKDAGWEYRSEEPFGWRDLEIDLSSWRLLRPKKRKTE